MLIYFFYISFVYLCRPFNYLCQELNIICVCKGPQDHTSKLPPYRGDERLEYPPDRSSHGGNRCSLQRKYPESLFVTRADMLFVVDYFSQFFSTLRFTFILSFSTCNKLYFMLLVLFLLLFLYDFQNNYILLKMFQTAITSFIFNQKS